MPKRRAVITGLGPITAIGIGRENFWRGLRAEKSGIGVGGDGRSRAVRADPFESSSIALEEIKRPSDEDSGDGRLARAHRPAPTGRQLDDARLVGQWIEDRDLIL